MPSAILDANFDDVGGLAVRIALHTGNADEREATTLDRPSIAYKVAVDRPRAFASRALPVDD